MTLYPHPQKHIMIENNEFSSAWNKWFEEVKDEVNRGEIPKETQNINAVDGISVVSPRTNLLMRVISASSGDANITKNPQITFGFDGQVITLIGQDDTKTVTLHDGDGLHLSSGITLKKNTNLVLRFDKNQNLWIEQSRALT